jgi:hypothetical protein
MTVTYDNEGNLIIVKKPNLKPNLKVTYTVAEGEVVQALQNKNRIETAMAKSGESNFDTESIDDPENQSLVAGFKTNYHG